MFASNVPLISVPGKTNDTNFKNEHLHLFPFCSKWASIWAGFQKHFSWVECLNDVMEYHADKILYLCIPWGSLPLCDFSSHPIWIRGMEASVGYSLRRPFWKHLIELECGIRWWVFFVCFWFLIWLVVGWLGLGLFCGFCLFVSLVCSLFYCLV